MKKALKMLAMLLCVAAVATLSSCSKDNEDLIIGKWEVVVDNFNTNGNGSFRHQSGNDIGEIWEFKTGGVLTVDGDDDLTYSVSDNSIVIMGGIESGTITTLTKSKLVLDLEIKLDKPYPQWHIEFKKI